MDSKIKVCVCVCVCTYVCGVVYLIFDSIQLWEVYGERRLLRTYVGEFSFSISFTNVMCVCLCSSMPDTSVRVCVCVSKLISDIFVIDVCSLLYLYSLAIDVCLFLS